MSLKLYACGPSDYFSSKFNKFDFSVSVFVWGVVTQNRTFNVTSTLFSIRKKNRLYIFVIITYQLLSKIMLLLTKKCSKTIYVTNGFR